MAATRDDQRDRPATAAKHPPAITLFMITAAVLLAVDLWTKHTAFEHVAGEPVALERDAEGRLDPIPPHSGVVLVPNVLALRLTLNEGAVFGLGQGGRWVFVGFTAIAVSVLTYVFLRSPPRARVLHIALGMVLAGALGNLYDRLVYGVVRDLLHLFPGVRLPFGWSWPDGSDGLYPWIFNVADVCLVCGLVVLMIIMFHHDRQEKREATARRQSN
jgi:signal peptidase II